jgi:hypothetical protein
MAKVGCDIWEKWVGGRKQIPGSSESWSPNREMPVKVTTTEEAQVLRWKPRPMTPYDLMSSTNESD